MASGANFFRGTSLDQDSRFFNHHKKLLAKMKFPASFGQKVNIAKVNKDVIHQWVTEKIQEVLGFEDDIVISMACNLLEPPNPLEPLDPKEMQVALTGFLEGDAAAFMKELWELLLSAQENPTGIPQIFLERKKKEMELKRAAEAHAREKLQKKIQDMNATNKNHSTQLRAQDQSSRRPESREQRPRGRQRSRDRRERSRSPNHRRRRSSSASPRSKKLSPRRERKDKKSSLSPARGKDKERKSSPSPRAERRRKHSSPSPQKKSRKQRSPSPEKTKENRKSSSPQSRHRRSPRRSRRSRSRERRRRSPEYRRRSRSRDRRSPSKDEFQREKRRRKTSTEDEESRLRKKAIESLKK
ncbi:hypothetical protein THRCLA_02277, partial [Thraustotheca clavata]